MGILDHFKFWKNKESKVSIEKVTKVESAEDLTNIIDKQKELKNKLKKWAKNEGYKKANKFEKALLMVSNKLPKIENKLGQIKRSINKENRRVIKEIKATIEEMEKVEPESKEIEAGIKEIKGNTNKAVILNTLVQVSSKVGSKSVQKLNYSSLWEKVKGEMAKATFSKYLKELVEEDKVERIEGKGKRVFYKPK